MPRAGSFGTPLLVLSLLLGACSANVHNGKGGGATDDGAATDDADVATDDGGPTNGDDAAAPGCANTLNLEGCACDHAGDVRACYTGPSATRGKGICKDGMQSCVAAGEFAAWGPCTGDVRPESEAGHCKDTLDNDCNGLVDCKDAACLADPACPMKQCMPGATRPCYTGPQGTAGVGQCKPGIQTCDQNGMWSANCAGEVTPGSELFHCHDNVDNDCNGKTDCMDLVCLLDPGCAPMVCTPNAMRACYDGPMGTENVGPCKGGMQTCAQDGKSWGPCNGEVVPQMEGGHCNDGIDNDCNGPIDCKDPACATAPNCCVMGNVMVDGTIYAHSTDTLYTLDPNNWSLAMIGPFNVNDSMTDIAMTPNGQLYAISFTGLYRVDKNTGNATFVANVPGMGNNSLTFLPDGSLLASDTAGDVKKIDPNAGTVMAIGNYGNSLSSSGDLVGVGDGTMYGVSATTPGGGDASNDNVLIRVNPQTGQATVVGPIGFGGVWGLAYAGARLIGFTNNGLVLQIDPQTGKGTQVANKGVNFWGAGMSPLVPANQCP